MRRTFIKALHMLKKKKSDNLIFSWDVLLHSQKMPRPASEKRIE